MPELPEVETICRELRQVLPGQVIAQVEVLRPSVVRKDHGAFVQSLTGCSFQQVERKAKYLLFHLSQGAMLAHLGMSGKFVYDAHPQAFKAHDRVIFHLSNGANLIFSEIRCFGFVEFITNAENHPRLRRLGPDALSAPPSALEMKARAKKTRKSIKEFIMDQRTLAGLGNIYACEILFGARLNPTKQAGRLTSADWERFLSETKRILNLALKHNGTSISDYRRVDDKQGEFQNFLQVYGKEGQPCPRCGKGIKKIAQGGRGTWFCC